MSTRASSHRAPVSHPPFPRHLYPYLAPFFGAPLVTHTCHAFPVLFIGTSSLGVVSDQSPSYTHSVTSLAASLYTQKLIPPSSVVDGPNGAGAPSLHVNSPVASLARALDVASTARVATDDRRDDRPAPAVSRARAEPSRGDAAGSARDAVTTVRAPGARATPSTTATRMRASETTRERSIDRSRAALTSTTAAATRRRVARRRLPIERITSPRATNDDDDDDDDDERDRHHGHGRVSRQGATTLERARGVRERARADAPR
jgi:hypothetical protein